MEYAGSIPDTAVQNRVKQGQIIVGECSDDPKSVSIYPIHNPYWGVDIEIIKLFAERYGYSLSIEEMEFDNLMQVWESWEM